MNFMTFSSDLSQRSPHQLRSTPTKNRCQKKLFTEYEDLVVQKRVLSSDICMV